MLEAAWLIPAFPLAAFVVLAAFGRRLGRPAAGWLATGAAFGAFVSSAVVFFGLLAEPEEDRVYVQTLFGWLSVGGLDVDIGFLVDPLSITFALFVTGVGTLIHLYSIGYMAGDEGFSRFFVAMSLFTFFMLVLVLGDSLLLTFLGWEGVGLCSYLLISFWFSDEANAVAGKKAFITNRVGDWGFMVAMFLAFFAVGSLDYTELVPAAAALAPVTAAAIAVFLFVGAVGKSAQLPLYLWLPDAMAGPTPVSALIHAATMVTAGVYLMVRISPVLAVADDWVLTTIAVVGALTALFSASIAVAQYDIKRVLAFSTISQLGFTFFAVGSGAYVAAVFHVVTHAFFKALLFLGAGSVIHGMDDEQDMRRMGGLVRAMPITAATFIVGWLAIAGVPPLSGFWSKDEILVFGYEKSPVLWAVGVVAALLTAFYMSRAVFLTFFGEARWRDTEPRPHPHEPPWTMTVPLVVLGVLAVVGGLLNLPIQESLKHLEHWLEPVVHGAEAELTSSTALKVGLAGIAIVASFVGIGLAAVVYLARLLPARWFERTALARAWYVDDAVSATVGGPGRRLFDAVARFDSTVIDGAVNGIAVLVRSGGSRLRSLQTGYVRTYALGVTIGAVLLVGFLLARATL